MAIDAISTNARAYENTDVILSFPKQAKLKACLKEYLKDDLYQRKVENILTEELAESERSIFGIIMHINLVLYDWNLPTFGDSAAPMNLTSALVHCAAASMVDVNSKKGKMFLRRVQQEKERALQTLSDRLMLINPLKPSAKAVEQLTGIKETIESQQEALAKQKNDKKVPSFLHECTLAKGIREEAEQKAIKTH